MENKWSTKPGQEWIKCPHCEITFRRKAALATAPPEQGAQQQPCDCQQLCEKLSNPLPPGRFCMAEAAQEKMRAEPPQAGTLPQAASAVALSAEQVEDAVDRSAGYTNFIPMLTNRLNALLASHDQKVRAEVLEEACDSVQKAIDVWKTWENDDGYEAIQTALGIMHRIRSLALGAVSKEPFAGAGSPLSEDLR